MMSVLLVLLTTVTIMPLVWMLLEVTNVTAMKASEERVLTVLVRY